MMSPLSESISNYLKKRFVLSISPHIQLKRANCSLLHHQRYPNHTTFPVKRYAYIEFDSQRSSVFSISNGSDMAFSPVRKVPTASSSQSMYVLRISAVKVL